MEDFTTMDDEYCFVCVKCAKAFCFLEDMEIHLCVEKEYLSDNLLSNSGITNYSSIAENPGIFIQPSTSKDLECDASPSESYAATEVVELNAAFSPDDLDGGAVVLEQGGELRFLLDDTSKKPEVKPRVKRRKDYAKNDYHLNKLKRDPYFKLDNNTYTFKDTLGDWDEKGTRLLIILIGRFPKSHFLLQYYFERRLQHWETINSHMHSAGYNFTILQLRMRWRELLCKYRKICNHNDLNKGNNSFEYMTEMNELFGTWTEKATESLLHLIAQSYADNPASRQRRLGFNGWQRIANELASLGNRFGTMQVEARWRMIVTNYKSMIDHNLMPTVEPIKAAYSDKLSKLVHYEPRRRKDYEKYKGKKIKLEKFPENVMKLLIAEYSKNAARFIDGSVNNAIVWEDVKKGLADLGHNYPISKLKEILFAKLKLCDRSVQHNMISGAIKREGPHFAELTQIYNTYGCWPHVKRRTKTQNEKAAKRCEVKLRESMQTWHSEESRAVLKVYSNVLATYMPSITKKQVNPIWLQVAQAHEKLGHAKRAMPEIVIQLSLLRQGYTQGNNFPFSDEMKLILDIEERRDFSPDMTPYNGGVEILYWSHPAVYLMLDLYLEIQPLLPYSSLSTEVYSRISKEMSKQHYNYTSDDISNELRVLLIQYTTKRHKIDKSASENWGKRKSILMYKEKLKEVMRLREKLSLSFTNGIRPIPEDVVNLIYKVARHDAESLFSQSQFSEDGFVTRLKALIISVRKELRKIVGRKPPAITKICVQLLSGLSYVADDLIDNRDLVKLYSLIEKYNYQTILTEFIKESQNGTFKHTKNMFGLGRISCDDRSEDSAGDTCVLRVGDATIDTILSSLLTKEFEMPVECLVSTDQAAKCVPAAVSIDTEDVTLEEAMSNCSKEEDSKSFVFMDQRFAAGTTVQPASENGVTYISFDDISLKNVSS